LGQIYAFSIWGSATFNKKALLLYHQTYNNTTIMSITEQHLYGYYDGLQSVTVVKEGFNFANAIIEKIRPLAH
jgi:hypothetical protein